MFLLGHRSFPTPRPTAHPLLPPTRSSIYMYRRTHGSCVPADAAADGALHVLNLSTLVWAVPDAAAAGPVPPARLLFGFAAAGDGRLFVFGGATPDGAHLCVSVSVSVSVCVCVRRSWLFIFG